MVSVKNAEPLSWNRLATLVLPIWILKAYVNHSSTMLPSWKGAPAGALPLQVLQEFCAGNCPLWDDSLGFSHLVPQLKYQGHISVSMGPPIGTLNNSYSHKILKSQHQ